MVHPEGADYYHYDCLYQSVLEMDCLYQSVLEMDCLHQSVLDMDCLYQSVLEMDCLYQSVLEMDQHGRTAERTTQNNAGQEDVDDTAGQF